jgi:hypothetical protein
MSDEMNGLAAIELVLLDPVVGGRFALGPPFSPGLFCGVGDARKNPQHRCRVMMADAAFILPMRDIQGVMGAVCRLCIGRLSTVFMPIFPSAKIRVIRG